jgi:hypothetical protein
MKLFAVLLFPLIFVNLSSSSYAQNADSLQEKLTFSSTRGFYQANFILTLSATTPGLPIQYTLDGTDPVSSKTVIKGVSPLEVSVDPANTEGHDLAPGFCVRAVGMENGTALTKIKTHTFIFAERATELSPDGQRPGPGWPQQQMSGNGQWFNYGLDPQVYQNSLYRDKFLQALLDIPSMSVVMDLRDLFDPQRGIFVNANQHGIDWERPCSLELINPDGSDGFQIDAGIRIRGGYSRSNQNPKHAFRFFFRTEYGKGKLDYPLFGDEGVDEFDSFDLRTSQNYSWAFDGSDLNTMNRDVFSRDCQRDMGQPYTRSRYYHLYINGTYWGLFQMQERSEASFAASYFGGVPEDYDVVKVAADRGYVVEATDGTLDTWRRLWEIAKNGFLSDSSYYLIQGKNPDGTPNPAFEVLLDIDNLIDYMLITFVTGNYDAPISNFMSNTSPNNFYAIYNRNGREGFKFFQHDSEHTMRADPWGLDRTGPFPAGNTFDKSNPQYLHQQLIAHPQYRARFADHVSKNYFNDGALTPWANVKRFMSRKEQIDLAIIAESARWGDSKREPAFTRDNEWLNAINWIVEQFFPNRTQIVLNQLKSKGWYPQVAPPRFNIESGRVPAGHQLQISGAEGNVYYTTDGSDPFLPSVTAGESKILFSENVEKYVLVPSAEMDFLWRRIAAFDVSSWIKGSGALGYERSSGYEQEIKIDVGDRMYDKQTSCYVRIPFTVNKDEFKDYNMFQLRMKYDDGFVAYLNGWKVAEALAPESLTWNAQATGNHEADAWETFDLSPDINRILDGDNFLAVHALNVSTTSSDFIIAAELTISKVVNSGAVSETASVYRNSLAIDKSTTVKARILSGEDWSAMADVSLYVVQGMENLKVTEINYHPLDDQADVDDDDRYEFIELKNTGDSPLDLSGAYFSRGIDYKFAIGSTMQAGSFIVLAADAVGFEERYGFQPFGQYNDKLDNSGETLAFNTTETDTLFKIHYNDRYPWPRSADGGGYSITTMCINPYLDQNDGWQWIASSVINGTPGRDDNAAALVNEKQEHSVQEYRLDRAYPNPFNPQTTISFSLPRNAVVRLEIFNLLGQKVDTLVDGRLPAGRHAATWNGAGFSSGIYFYRLTTENFSQARKFTLIR